jgi:hypothetical protein
MPSYYEKQIPAGRSNDRAGIENYFTLLNFLMTFDSAAPVRRRTWLFSKTQPPIQREKNLLASPNKRVIFALQLRDDVAECN